MLVSNMVLECSFYRSGGFVENNIQVKALCQVKNPTELPLACQLAGSIPQTRRFVGRCLYVSEDGRDSIRLMTICRVPKKKVAVADASDYYSRSQSIAIPRYDDSKPTCNISDVIQKLTCEQREW